MPITPGSRLGPYEILAPIGAGGMGEVYRARDTRLERSVAIKVLPDHLSKSPEVRQRFEREAKTISQLSHPHICALYDVGHEGDTEYLVMELLEGETLAERLRNGAASARPDAALRYGDRRRARQGAPAGHRPPGSEARQRHADALRASSCSTSVWPRVSRPAAAAGSLTALPTQANLTQEGTILGTFQYMAPEQLEGRESDARTDIFAFGAVLYEMVTGKKAFAGASQASLISSILRDDPQPISQVQPMAPAALDRVVKTCLAKDPDDRWQSAADLKRELRWIGEGSQAGVPTDSLSPRRGERGRVRGGRFAWAVAALLLLGALYLGSELVRMRGAKPQPIHSYLIPPEGTSFRLTGDEAAPIAISPDGASVAFGAANKLWVQSLRTGRPRSLASTEGAQFPFWSPDGRSIGFFAGGKLKTVEAAGGPGAGDRRRADAPRRHVGQERRHRLHAGLSGRALARPRFGRPNDAADQGGPLSATRPIAGRLSCPTAGTFSTSRPATATRARSSPAIYVASLDGGEPRRVMPSYGSAQYVPGYLLSVRDSNLMAAPFDLGRLAVTGQSVRVAGDVNFDFGTWRGVLHARPRTACSPTRSCGTRSAASSPGSTWPAGRSRRSATGARRTR